ncbi:putative C2H2 finger domain protein, partial [Aspergillus homomorphus CBS 101889]
SLLAIPSPLLDPPDISGGLPGSRYWTLGPESVAFPPGTLSSTLTNPAVNVVDLYPSTGFSRDTTAAMAALAIPPPGMGPSSLEALTAPQPLNTRRPGAPPLPSMELPTPNFAAALKYAHLPNPSALNPSVSNLLTPPATSQSGETTPVTTAQQTSAAGVPSVPATPDLGPFWSSQSSYGSASGAAAARQSWASSLSPYASRDTFSPPGSNAISRNPVPSSSGADPIPQGYEMNQLPPFQQSIPVSAAGVAPGATPQQPPHALTHAVLSAQHGLPNPIPSPHPLPSNDPYMVKSSSAPAYSTVQQLASPPGSYSPYGPTGLSMHPPGRVASNPHPSHHLNYQRQPWPSYSIPASNGPVWTNVHNPNGHMSLTGNPPMMPLNFNSGTEAYMQRMYGGHHPHPGHGGPGQTNDRPFKCDQCPQSFNRNHDLKRHKRIHLSVKPFPCNHCDKSFSRKDALKRHMLVKGCGKDGVGAGAEPGAARPTVKEEDRSDDSNGQA